jgi:Na+-transporting NADH:ubiquinone oxidoreductase subunit C
VHSTRYVILFILAITSLSALALAFLSTTYKDRHERNEAIFNKRAILSAVEGPMGKSVADLSDQDVQDIFNSKISQVVLNMDGEEVGAAEVQAHGHKGGTAEAIDMAKERKQPEKERLLPLFIYDEDGKEYYIVSVRGSGLWDEIWGNIALEDDFNTIAGAAFDHKGETPGLGAEIKDNPAFPAQFVGKKIYSPEGTYTSVVVRKGGAVDKRYEVDGISGATITANGVTEMLYRGIKYYQPYFSKLREN